MQAFMKVDVEHMDDMEQRVAALRDICRGIPTCVAFSTQGSSMIAAAAVSS
jgi:hypothetical protein